MVVDIQSGVVVSVGGVERDVKGGGPGIEGKERIENSGEFII
jgi:hypothetical protein